MFKLQSPLDTQNNRIYGKTGTKNEILDERLYVERRAFPKSIMISAGVSMMGKTTIHFVEPKIRMDGPYYCKEVLGTFIPQMKRMCPNFILQQDGARCHTSAYSIKYIRENTPEFLEPEIWLPNCLWGYVEVAIHRNCNVKDLEQLQREIVNAWNDIRQDVIKRAILAFPKRLRLCIKANGGHIEHFL